MRVYDISEDFLFCEGEVGVDDFSGFLEKLPEINAVYSSPPKREYLSMWYQLAGREAISSESFYHGFFRVLQEVDAPEYHIEVGASNERLVRDFFEDWDIFSHQTEQEMLYSAPVDLTNRLAKCRKPTKMLVFSRVPIEVPVAGYSHEYLDLLLQNREKMNLFDPTIGKGLLARCAVRYGHSCFGIEMNPDRLKVTLEFVKMRIERS